MAKKQSPTAPARQRGSAKTTPTPPAASPSRPRSGVQSSLPHVPDVRDTQLEELDASLAEAKREASRLRDTAKAIELSMLARLKILKLAAYKTASGFVVRADLKTKLERRPMPKAKPRAKEVPACSPS